MVLKFEGEDEEWGPEGEAMPAETPTVSPPLPRLRLNTSLATDPALTTPPQATPPPAPQDYLTNFPTALQSVIAAGLFPLSLSVDVPTSAASRAASNTPEPATRQLTVPLYTCTPCGIRFSSISTLEAHQTYYCSHRVQKPAAENEDSKSNVTEAGGSTANDETTSEGPNKVQRTGKQYTCTHCSYSADKKVSLNRHMRMHTVSPSPPSLPGSVTSNGDVNPDLSSPPIQLQDRYCADCDIRFSSTKTLRAHKMHYCSTRQVVKSTPNSVASVTPAVTVKSGSSCTSGSAPTSPNENCKSPPSPTSVTGNSQPLLALPTNPILIVPYSLFRNASVLAGSTVAGLTNTDTPCFLMPNGTLQPMTQALSQSSHRSAVQNSTSEVLKSANKPREPQIIRDPSIPLDLSIRRTPEHRNSTSGEMDEQEKENRLHHVITPEQIVCAPSLPGSPPLTPSPRPGASPESSESSKHKYQESRSNSPKQTCISVKSNSDDSVRMSPKCKTPVHIGNTSMLFPVNSAIHPLLLRSGSSLLTPEIALRLSAELSGFQATPQVLVKQGVSKCKECNIVFCKYENYLAHKKHYCSARGQKEEVDGTKPGVSPPISPNNNLTGKTSPIAYQQLICAACGIKFTSLDNLTAHQSYYCLKRSEIQVKNTDADVRKCPKCKSVMEAGHVCAANSVTPVALDGSGGWRCPCCDVVSATASAAQKHMDSHSGVKAFRCTICRYKGNTLRGMRTHIRMHFQKRAADLQEENFITCILEDDNSRGTSESSSVGSAGGATTPVPVITALAPPPPLTPSPPRGEKLYNCESCNYSSTYKGNVVRHNRLVHSGSDAKSPDLSLIGEGDESLVLNGNNDSQNLTKNILEEEPRPNVIIKQEVHEPDVDVVESDVAVKTETVDTKQIKDEVNSKDVPTDENSVDTDAIEEKMESKYCKSCDISFKYMSTYMAHKKFYCSGHAGEVVAGNNNIPVRATEASVL